MRLSKSILGGMSVAIVSCALIVPAFAQAKAQWKDRKSVV